MSAARETLVVTFGGTSLGTPARIRRAARRVAALGAARAARLAWSHGVPLRVFGYDASLQDETSGTFVGGSP